MGDEFSVVGKRLPRADAAERATGAAKFAGDVILPELLIGKVLRSPYPHAKILKIDKSKAENLPGVECVMTLEDVVPRKRFTGSFQDLPLLTRGAAPERADQYVFADKARFIGDPIAAVAAINEHIAEEALELIEVEYEQLPAVFDPIEAVKPGAPKIHDHAENNIAYHAVNPLSEGNVEKAFQEADCVVEDTFRTTKQIHCQMESAASVATFDANGRLTVWSQCQMPHPARRELAYIFDIPVGKVRLITPHVGGSFGGRNSVCLEPIVIALAKKTGKPVKIEHTKDEDFHVCDTRTPFIYHAKLGFKKDGTLTAIQVKGMTQAGGYLSRSTTCTSVFLGFSIGLYRCPNKLAENDLVYTNTTPSGAYRGMGHESAMWGIEQLVDRAAQKLGMDPLEIRLKNLKKAGEPSYVGLPIQSIALEDCIRVGAAKIGWHEKRQKKEEGIKKRGVGVAVMMHTSGSQPHMVEHSSVYLKLNEDGSADLVIHPGDAGTGSPGALSQIAAEELGLRSEDIHVVYGDTDVTLFDIGSIASRTVYITGNAVLKAAREAKGQLLERASKRLGVLTDDLEIKDRQIYNKADPNKKISIAEVVHDAIYNLKHECLGISGKGVFEPTTMSPPTQAAFAEVEVDTETGRVKVLRMVIAHDIGKAINPMTVEGQIEGGVSQGLGYALTEDPALNMDTGELINDSYETYKIPSTLDMPEVEVILVEKPDPIGPFGAKGVGEPGIINIAPAIANAIYNAIGIQITELPITPEKILKALEVKSKS
jgi:xanthine dehydrogenase molybdenum-binding subunit